MLCLYGIKYHAFCLLKTCQQQSILRQIVINGYDPFTVSKSHSFSIVAVYTGTIRFNYRLLRIRIPAPQKQNVSDCKLNYVHSKRCANELPINLLYLIRATVNN